MKLLAAALLLLASVASAQGEPAEPRRTVSVVTSPPGGQLVIAGLLAGRDGLTLTQPEGTRVTVGCMLLGNAGWTPGRAEVRFDGSMSSAVCEMERQTRCVAELRNPFRTCQKR